MPSPLDIGTRIEDALRGCGCFSKAVLPLPPPPHRIEVLESPSIF
jgi:hypothetical protein